MSNQYDIKLFTPEKKLSADERVKTVNFLYTHLDEYGDLAKDIDRAIEYALSDSEDRGGFVLTLNDGDKVIGSVVINETGMSGYIPENILVYIAMNREYRGKGLGKRLMKRAIEVCDGDIALHVEPDNPARFLYEKLGFENKYLEMRLKNTPKKNTTQNRVGEKSKPGPAKVTDEA